MTFDLSFARDVRPSFADPCLGRRAPSPDANAVSFLFFEPAAGKMRQGSRADTREIKGGTGPRCPVPGRREGHDHGETLSHIDFKEASSHVRSGRE